MSTFDLRTGQARWRFNGLVVGLRRAVDLVLVWHQRARQRRQLRSLSNHMLRDIGLTRADVLAEASKPFWRL